jgi:hypothetical protein
MKTASLMQPFAAESERAVEDLDAVLGRFQTWSASCRTKENATQKANDLPNGVRELSYEEALESSRYRWQARNRPPASESARKTEAISEEEQPTPHSTLVDEAILSDKVTLSPAAEMPTRTTDPPAFGSVLAGALPDEPDPDALALVWPAAPKSERQVSMSLRVAASEQALIKARAAEVGLSVSAYLRQCALEVEKLRTQVHHTLALLEQRSGQTPVRSLAVWPPSNQVSRSGFLSRLQQRIFGSPTRLTLHA